jgi:ribosomal protein L11 methyltransferase
VRCGSIDVVKGETYDFVLANINRNILLNMMPSFAEALLSGGKLLMSGFFIDDAPAIESVAAEYGFAIAACQEREGWTVMYCVKS